MKYLKSCHRAKRKSQARRPKKKLWASQKLGIKKDTFTERVVGEMLKKMNELQILKWIRLEDEWMAEERRG